MRCRLDIARHPDAFASGSLDQVPRFFSVLVLVEIGNEEVRPFARKGHRHGPANT